MTSLRFDPFSGSIEATAELWQRLARPFEIGPTVDALIGLSPEVVVQLAGVLVATCDEAETLLDAMPVALRNLKTAIGANHERCYGELRGPVQWSETVAAQGSSLGNRDVFVCESPERAYDIDENQVLVGALRAVADAGRRIESVEDESYVDDGLRRIDALARAAPQIFAGLGDAAVDLGAAAQHVVYAAHRADQLRQIAQGAGALVRFVGFVVGDGALDARAVSGPGFRAGIARFDVERVGRPAIRS